jgi:hypothetical protein
MPSGPSPEFQPQQNFDPAVPQGRLPADGLTSAERRALHAERLLEERQRLLESFRRYCTDTDLDIYRVPERLPAQYQEFSLPRQSKERSVFASVDLSLALQAAKAPLSEQHLEGAGLSRSGQTFMCLYAMVQPHDGVFVLPAWQPLRPGAGASPIRQVRMAQDFEVLREAAGVVGAYESKHWKNATLKLFLSPEAFSEAEARISAISSFVTDTTKPGKEAAVVTVVPETSLLLACLLHEVQKTLKSQEMFSPSEDTKLEVLGLTRLKHEPGTSMHEIGVLVMEIDGVAKNAAEGPLVLQTAPKLCEHVESVEIRPDPYGFIHAEVRDVRERPFTFR